MNQNIERRTFLAVGAASLAATATASAEKADDTKSKTPKGFKKATKYYMVQPGKSLPFQTASALKRPRI